VIAGVIFVLLQGGCREGTTRDVLATVLFVDGPATFGPANRAPFVPLTLGTHPGKGDAVHTPDSSRTALALVPNLLIQLDRDARLQIVSLTLIKDGNETGNAMRGRFADVALTGGRMFASHSWGEATAAFKVRTPQGDMTTPSNALVCVEVAKDKTRVICASGWVEFLPLGAASAIRIPPGSVGEWPAPSANITAAESDPRAQEDLQQAIEVEQMLRGLAAPKRNVLPR
jgi:hypothetical protein